MYTQYFGLKENPFALPPDPRYLYQSQRHQDALAHLLYGITGGGGFVQLSGEVGTGKTLIVRALLQRLPENVDVALVLYPFLTVREFMQALCDDLRIPRPAGDSLKALLDTLNAFLLDNHAKGRRTVLIVDEAHRLNREVLEQIRLLTNLETTKEKLLQIVLAGQPELNSLLAQPDMRQLAQRITARYELRALSASETRAYVQHRCRVAGASAALFSGPALWLVHRLTGGVPRLINLLCDRALLAAYARGRNRVTLGLLRAAAREVDSGQTTRRRVPALGIALAALLVAAVAAIGVWRYAPEQLPAWIAAQRPADQAPAEAAPPAANPPPATSAAAEPVSPPTPAPAAPPTTLAQILSDPVIPTDTDTAFSVVFARWGLDYARFAGSTGCDRAHQAGLRCLLDAGTWNSLRQLDRPVIIELVEQGGRRHHVAVTQLGDERVTLEFPGRRIELPLTELGDAWFGKYLTLWRPPQTGEGSIRRGMRGTPVLWLREALVHAGLSGAGGPDNDRFDRALEDQVREFQRRHQLQDDGIVGRMTLVHLSRYDQSAGVVPLLSAAADATPVR